MNIYRNNKNGLLYTLELLVLDVKFLNGNARSGLYPHPHNHDTKLSPTVSKDAEVLAARKAEFTKVSEI